MIDVQSLLDGVNQQVDAYKICIPVTVNEQRYLLQLTDHPALFLQDILYSADDRSLEVYIFLSSISIFATKHQTLDCNQTDIRRWLHKNFTSNVKTNSSVVRAFTFAGENSVIQYSEVLPAQAFSPLAQALKEGFRDVSGPYKAFFLSEQDELAMVGPLFDIDILWDHFVRLYRIQPEDLIPGPWRTLESPATRRGTRFTTDLPSSASSLDDGRGGLRPLQGFSIAQSQSQSPAFKAPGPQQQRNSARPRRQAISADDSDYHTEFAPVFDLAGDMRVDDKKAELDDFVLDSSFTVKFFDENFMTLDAKDLAELDGNECIHDRCADAYVSNRIMVLLIVYLTCLGVMSRL
jgi:hypothetical protein